MFKKVLLILGMLCLGAPQAFCTDAGTIEVNFDEAIQDSAVNYYITDDYLTTSKEKIYTTPVILTIKDPTYNGIKTLYYGMTESEVHESLSAPSDDVVVVLTIGKSEDDKGSPKERLYDVFNFNYKNGLLYRVGVRGSIILEEGNFYGADYSKIKSEFGDNTYMNTYIHEKGKGIIEYQEKCGYKYFCFEDSKVSEWGFSNRSMRDREEWPSKYVKRQVNFDNGNSIGNILNGGLITAQNGWSYYAQPLLEKKGEALYRMTDDGLNKELLALDKPRYINVKDKWLYYINLSDPSASGEGKIYRIKTDGTEREELSDLGGQYLSTDGEYLYFTSEGNGIDMSPGVYRMSVDGEGLIQLAKGRASHLNLSERELIYLIESETDAVADEKDNPLKIIQRIDRTGAGKEAILEGNFGFLLVQGYAYYYSDLNNGHQIFCLYTDAEFSDIGQYRPVSIVGMNTLGHYKIFQTIFNEYAVADDLGKVELTKETQQQFNNINVIGEKIYFQSHIEGVGPLYEKSFWESDSYQVEPELASAAFMKNQTENHGGWLAIQDDWIYYVNRKDHQALYRVNKQTSQLEKVSDSRTQNLFTYKNQLYCFMDNSLNAGQYTLVKINDKNEILPIKGIGDYKVEKAISLDEKVLLFYNGKQDSTINEEGTLLVSIEGNKLVEEMKISQNGLYYGSNKWLYFAGAEGKIGRRLIDKFPEPEVVMGTDWIVGSWNDWIYYVSNSYNQKGLYRLHSDTKETQRLNNLDMMEARLYKNNLIYIDSKETSLIISDLKGENQQVLVAENVAFINVISDWIFYSDGQDTYRIKTDGSGLERLDAIKDLEK